MSAWGSWESYFLNLSSSICIKDYWKAINHPRNVEAPQGETKRSVWLSTLLMYNKEDSQRLTPASISLLHLPSRWAALYKLGTPNNGFLRVTKKTVTNHSAGHSRLGTEDTTCCDFALTVMRTLRPESAKLKEERQPDRQLRSHLMEGGGGARVLPWWRSS